MEMNGKLKMPLSSYVGYSSFMFLFSWSDKFMPESRQTQRSKWCGTTVCEICQQLCDYLLIDGLTTTGRRVCMCEECFKQVGQGLGPGVGQLYELTDEGYTKVG